MSAQRRLGALAVVAMLSLASCGKSRAIVGAPGANGDASFEGGATVDAGADSTAGCLDEPGALARPATDRLPCELVPPGLRL